jgi:hypothetical protein
MAQKYRNRIITAGVYHLRGHGRSIIAGRITALKSHWEWLNRSQEEKANERPLMIAIIRTMMRTIVLSMLRSL